MEPLLIQLVSGAVGGNIAGAAMKDKSLGTLGNSVAGLVGGGLGGQILSAILGGSGAAAGPDLGAVVGQAASGGVGGAILMIAVGIIKSAMSR